MDNLGNVITAFLLGALIMGIIITATNKTVKYKYEVKESKRLDDCTYEVWLLDENDNTFPITQDLIIFAAMGVNTNEILIQGEL